MQPRQSMLLSESCRRKTGSTAVGKLYSADDGPEAGIVLML